MFRRSTPQAHHFVSETFSRNSIEKKNLRHLCGGFYLGLHPLCFWLLWGGLYPLVYLALKHFIKIVLLRKEFVICTGFNNLTIFKHVNNVCFFDC